MTQAQINHYRGLWAAVRRVLRQKGMSSAECDKHRHEIHRQVLGRAVSSLRLSNKQFDLVKGAFLAITEPADLFAQEKAQDGDRIRGRHVIADLCARLGYDDERLQGTIDQMQREGRLREPDRARGSDAVEAWDIELGREAVPRLTLNDLTAEELEPVIIALRLQVAREEERQAAELAAPSFNF